jgi:hypothetical protein
MRSRFASGVYGPELVAVMAEAFEAAWAKFEPPPKNVDLARQFLASAIIEAVESGAREPKVLAARAVRVLDAAIHRDPAALNTGWFKPRASGWPDRRLLANYSDWRRRFALSRGARGTAGWWRWAISP